MEGNKWEPGGEEKEGGREGEKERGKVRVGLEKDLVEGISTWLRQHMGLSVGFLYKKFWLTLPLHPYQI